VELLQHSLISFNVLTGFLLQLRNDNSQLLPHDVNRCSLMFSDVTTFLHNFSSAPPALPDFFPSTFIRDRYQVCFLLVCFSSFIFI